MVEMKHTVHINRPVQEVFDYVRDQRNEGKWHTDVIATDADGAVSEGDLVTWTVKFMGKSDYVNEVTDLVEPSLIRIKARRGAVLPTLTHTFAASKGGTVYTRHVSIPPRGMFRLVNPIMKATGAAYRRNASFAENLKALLEKSSNP